MPHTFLPPQLSEDMSDFVNYWAGYFPTHKDFEEDYEAAETLEKTFDERLSELGLQLRTLAERIADKSTLYTIHQEEE